MDSEAVIRNRINVSKGKVGIDYELYEWQKQALISISGYSQTIIGVPTGSGKSTISALLQPFLCGDRYEAILITEPLETIIFDQMHTIKTKYQNMKCLHIACVNI